MRRVALTVSCHLRAEQLYQKVMSLWHQLHVNMKSVVTWHYVLKDIRSVSGWTLDSVSLTQLLRKSPSFNLKVSPPFSACFLRQVRSQSPSERQQLLDHMASQLADFLSDSRESSLFTAAERRELERDAQQAQQHCQDLLLHMETGGGATEPKASVYIHTAGKYDTKTLFLNDPILIFSPTSS